MVGWLCASCGGADGDEDAPGKPHFEGAALEQVAQDLVDAHNAVRAGAQPAPAPALEDVTWDDNVAGIAQDYANQCRFEHSHHENLGENLAFFSGTDSTGADITESWASEAADYDYASNACADGAQCGHYTQIVWRDTHRMGCGISECTIEFCDGGSCDDVAGLLWVCNYSPPGNFVGERPY